MKFFHCFPYDLKPEAQAETHIKVRQLPIGFMVVIIPHVVIFADRIEFDVKLQRNRLREFPAPAAHDTRAEGKTRFRIVFIAEFIKSIFYL